MAWGLALAFGGGGAARADPIPAVQSSSNMTIIGHSDLNGAGKGGEGLALRQYPDGRRVLFLAHESAPMCVSVIDVTKPVSGLFAQSCGLITYRSRKNSTATVGISSSMLISNP